MGVIPRPEQIVQDVRKAVRAMKTIHDAKGAFVPSLAGGRVPGHRHCATSEKMNNKHSGKRTRLEYNLALTQKEVHPSLKSTLDDPEQDLTVVFKLQVDY